MAEKSEAVYLGMQDQVYTFPMFDVQAWYVRDIIMGEIDLPTDTEQLLSRNPFINTLLNDIDKWVAREELLSNPMELVNFQSNYLRDLFPVVDCQKFDFEKNFKEWVHHKYDNIVTYRDKSFASAVPGTTGPIHHTGWLHAMDDSLDTLGTK